MQKAIEQIKQLARESGFTKKQFDGMVLAARRALFPREANEASANDSHDSYYEALCIQDEVMRALYDSACPLTFSQIRQRLPAHLSWDISRALNILAKNRRVRAGKNNDNGANTFFPKAEDK